MVKNQSLVNRLSELEKHRDDIRKAVAPLEIERNKLQSQIEKLQEKWKDLGEQIAKTESEGDMRNVCNEIAALRRALGNVKKLKAEPGTIGVKDEK